MEKNGVQISIHLCDYKLSQHVHVPKATSQFHYILKANYTVQSKSLGQIFLKN
jgi:hypothetical protein